MSLFLLTALTLAGPPRVVGVSYSYPHHGHLTQALKDIRAAEVSARHGAKGPAERDITAAAIQVETAINSHHYHHRGVAAFAGPVVVVQHPHHTHLQHALYDLSLASRQVAAGHVKAAEKDLARAATQVHEAMQHAYHVPATPPGVVVR